MYDPESLDNPKHSGFFGFGWEGVLRGVPVLSNDKKKSALGLFTQGDRSAYIAEFQYQLINKTKKRIDTEPDFKHFSMWAGTNIGENVYFAGTPRKLFKRLRPGKWIDLTDEETHPHMYTDVNQILARQRFIMGAIPLGFHAVDGFAENDIYAGGEKGDCWHYDGNRWRALDLPTNVNIRSICCAPDGQVYIGCSQNTLVKGRLDTNGERWEVLPKADINSDEPFSSLAWFQDRLWIGGWQGTYRLENERGRPIVRPYVFPDGGAQQISFNGGVCSCDEVLMVWGESQVMLYDGEQWEDFLISAIPLDIPEEVQELLDG